MKIDSQKDLKYISMNKNNVSIFKDIILPVNTDYIFLFDIDDTLYKAKEEMEIVEMEKWKTAYNHYKNGRTDIPDFLPFLNSTNLYSEAFKIYFDKSPLEVEKFKGILDYSRYIVKDNELISYLETFPYRKWCFTNGMRCRAEPILKCLDIINKFEGVICMDDGCPDGIVLGKPKEGAYQFVEDLLQIKDKTKVFFFDDSKANIEMGHKMGWNSFLISKKDYIVDVLNNLFIDEVER